nr:transmembrane protease serine 13 [Pongo abelii]
MREARGATGPAVPAAGQPIDSSPLGRSEGRVSQRESTARPRLPPARDTQTHQRGAGVEPGADPAARARRALTRAPAAGSPAAAPPALADSEEPALGRRGAGARGGRREGPPAGTFARSGRPRATGLAAGGCGRGAGRGLQRRRARGRPSRSPGESRCPSFVRLSGSLAADGPGLGRSPRALFGTHPGDVGTSREEWAAPAFRGRLASSLRGTVGFESGASSRGRTRHPHWSVD